MEVTIRLAEEADFDGILALHRETMTDVVGDEEKAREGFVSLPFDEEMLQRIHDEIGMVVAIGKEGEFVGYEIPMNLNMAGESPLLDPFLEEVLELAYNGEVFTPETTVLEAQINVRKGYKGQGIAERLHVRWQELVREAGYKRMVTEISPKNPRSMEAHTRKLGMDHILTYETEDGQKWYVVAQELTD